MEEKRRLDRDPEDRQSFGYPPSHKLALEETRKRVTLEERPMASAVKASESPKRKIIEIRSPCKKLSPLKVEARPNTDTTNYCSEKNHGAVESTIFNVESDSDNTSASNGKKSTELTKAEKQKKLYKSLPPDLRLAYSGRREMQQI